MISGITRADHLLHTRTMREGNTIKSTNELLYGNSEKTLENYHKTSNAPYISISEIGKILSNMLSRGKIGSTSEAGFDSFLDSVHQQILEQGKDAKIFSELPSEGGISRTILAKQASNYLSTALYGGEEIYADASSENPFSLLDRRTLSHIAFNDTGAFSDVERQVAFLEITERDIDFRNKIFDLQTSLLENDGSDARLQITSLLGDAQLASAMSSGERKWRNWRASEDISNQALSSAKSLGLDVPTMPSYKNLKGIGDAILAIIPGQNGEEMWKNILVSNALKSDPNLQIMQSLSLFIEK